LHISCKIHTRQPANNDEILKYATLFDNKLTMETLNRHQLAAMCKLLEMTVFGNDQVTFFSVYSGLVSLNCS
jgi:hypothetical protein